jgi:hypothetical protein
MLKFANNDRSRLCCASFDGTVSICNVMADPPRVEVVFKGHKKGVTGETGVNNDQLAHEISGSYSSDCEVSHYLPTLARTVTLSFLFDITSPTFHP